jgi:hypothetical protein
MKINYNPIKNPPKPFFEFCENFKTKDKKKYGKLMQTKGSVEKKM